MHRRSDWEARQGAQKTADDADQVECAAVRYGVCNLEEGIRDDRTAGVLDDYQTPGPQAMERWAEADAEYDNATGAVAEEIERRARLLRRLYPFRPSGNKITYRRSHTLAYEFCLAVCQTQSLSAGEFRRLPIAFERLCRDVVKCYLGPDSQAYRTGWPRDRLEERPARFKGVVKELQRLTGEWQWSPEYGKPDDPKPRDIKDGGIDFVVWKRMPDGRAGQMFLLGQCACGNDWCTKFNNLNVEELKTWVRPLSAAPPLRVFAIPFHIPRLSRLVEVNSLAGLALDRARIVLIAERPENRDTIAAALRDPFGELIRLVIPGFEGG